MNRPGRADHSGGSPRGACLVLDGEGGTEIAGLASDEGRDPERTARVTSILDVFLIQQVGDETFHPPVRIGRLVGNTKVHETVGILIFILDPVTCALKRRNVVVVVKENL